MFKETAKPKLVRWVIQGLLYVALLLGSLSVQASNGQCKWEGGPGASGMPSDPYGYCKAEDCVEDGGLALCSEPRLFPADGNDSAADSEKWTYGICNWAGESFNSCAQSARMCRAAGGTPVGERLCGCENLPGDYINNNPTSLRSDGPILAQLIAYGQLVSHESCPAAALDTDTGYGFPNTDDYVCGGTTDIRNGAPVRQVVDDRVVDEVRGQLQEEGRRTD